MLIQILKSKIQRLIVSESSIDYPGSISIPDELLKASGIRQFEMVHVNNKTNGNRIITYAVVNNNEGCVTINGAASKLFNKGDEVHVLAYTYANEEELINYFPTLVLTNNENKVVETKPYVL